MAYGFTAASMYLKRTASLPNFTNWTISFWFKAISFPAQTLHALYERGASVGGRSTDLFILDSTKRMTIASSDGANSTNGTIIVAGVWYHVFVTKRGTSANVYVNGKREAFSPFTLNADNAAGDKLTLGIYDDETSFPFTGRIAHFKHWDNVVLGLDDAGWEMTSVLPKNTLGLYMWTPLRFNAKDVSGRASDWTVAGSPQTLADEPRIPWDADEEAARRVRTSVRPFIRTAPEIFLYPGET